MIAIIDENNYFVSYLYEITEQDKSRTDLVETDQKGLTTAYRYDNGVWISPEYHPRTDDQNIKEV